MIDLSKATVDELICIIDAMILYERADLLTAPRKSTAKEIKANAWDELDQREDAERED